MKTLLWVIVAIIVIGGGWYWWSSMHSGASPASPSTAAGINGSPNQGNLGQPATGSVQEPATTSGATAAPMPQIIGNNLALGTDKATGLGTYLIGYNGMTLYTYGNDKGTTSTCYGGCAAAWPPYIVSSSDNIHQLEAGVSGTVGTTARTDGSLQLTYDGHPLYFFAGDKASGDTKGEGLDGVWYVVKP